jgi:hypothetical protein
MDVGQDHGVGTDETVMADCYGAEHARTAANVHAIADGRNGTDFVTHGNPEGRVLADVDVIPDRSGMQYDPSVMPNSHSPPKPGGVRQVNAADELSEPGEKPEG